jgi:hypothetical protein
MSLASTTPSPGVMLPSATAAVIAPIAPAISAARVPYPPVPPVLSGRDQASPTRLDLGVEHHPAAFVARFVDPRGRPAGLPDRPFSTGRPRTRLLFFAVFCSDNSGMDISFRQRSPLIEKKQYVHRFLNRNTPRRRSRSTVTPYAFMLLAHYIYFSNEIISIGRTGTVDGVGRRTNSKATVRRWRRRARGQFAVAWYPKFS